MSEIKWIEGGTRELRNQGDFGGYCSYDYPEGFPYWCDSGYSVLWNEYHYGENRERRKQFPKELRRRKILPARVTFYALDENRKKTDFIQVDLEEDRIPVRTVLYILNHDKLLWRIRKQSRGG